MIQDYLLDAASKVGDHFAALGGLLASGFNGLNFSDPLNWTLGGILVPFAIACCIFAGWRYMRLRGVYGKRQLIDPTSDKVSLIGETVRLAFRLLVPLAIGVALLNPYVPGAPHRVPSGNRDYAICIADNKGMGAVDQPVGATPAGADAHNSGQFFNESGSRMDFVRKVIKGLLDKALVRTNVALIAFQGEANVVVPLTDSPDWLADTLDPTNKFGLRVGASSLVGKGQVDGKVSTIAACLQAARKVFEQDGVKSHEKFIIYFGNGDDISSEKWMADEVQKLREANIQGAIFGVGGSPIPIPVYNGDDEQFSGYYKFRNGKEALSGYNEENLLKLAQATGWRYTHLDPTHMPDEDTFIQELTDSKIVIGRWLIFDYPVEVALFVILLIALNDTLSWFARVAFRRRMQRRRR